MLTEYQSAYQSVGILHKIYGLRKALRELFPDAELNDITKKQIVERTLGNKLFENCQFYCRINDGQYSEKLPDAERICKAIERYNIQISPESIENILFKQKRFLVNGRIQPQTQFHK